MSTNLATCEIPAELESKLHEFRFRKHGESADTSAIIIKVDRESQSLRLEEELESTTIDELVSILPTHQPRFIIVSYKLLHSDSRISYPLVFLFSTPADCPPELQMLYAGCKLKFQSCIGIPRSFELRDLEELTEDWLKERLLLGK